MQLVVISDTHGKHEELGSLEGDVLVHCGDFCDGFRRDPRDLERVDAWFASQRFELVLCVAGNHDFAAVGKRTTDDFNYAAKASAEWTKGQLSKTSTQFVENLPLTATAETFTLVHGTLRDPLSEYLLDPETASANFKMMETDYCIVGHSHLPFICAESHGDQDGSKGPEFLDFTEDQVFPMPETRSIFNPGGVGQPRDRDPRSSYAVYDSQEGNIRRHRVAYDIAATQEKMRKAKLPEYLIDRLNHGH